MDKPKYTRTPDGKLTPKACLDISQYFVQHAPPNEKNMWETLHRSFIDEIRLNRPVWTSCFIIENRLSKDPEWEQAFVPWDERHKLND